MSLTVISAAQAALRLNRTTGPEQGFSAVIDARSEAEYALDCLPGAVNWPSLSNAQRVLVGSLYKQQGAFEAQKIGAALVAANISRHIEQHVLQLPRAWSPLVYCWRGGKRSHALAHVLSQIGFAVFVIDGGYKAFRQTVVESLPERVAPIAWRVICGPTGSGKTRLLQALSQVGAQVLDLEALARHRSSVLGLVPGQAQPSQKRFDTLVWQALGQFDPLRPVFVESESRKVGNLCIPLALLQAMRASRCLKVQTATELRVQLLLEDYPHFVQDAELFCERLQTLVDLRGHATVDAWCLAARQGQICMVVRQLLEQHYDPSYLQSSQRNFSLWAQAESVSIDDISEAAMIRVATSLACQAGSAEAASSVSPNPMAC